MTSLWISDSQERVLGPVSLQALQELAAAGRLGDIQRVSRDGKAWEDIHRSPELSHLFAGAPASAQRSQLAEARELLVRFRSQPTHAIFGLPERSTVEQYRLAFFELVKRFHPGQLPKGAGPELSEAYVALFELLRRRMRDVEGGPATPTPFAAGPAPAPKAPTPIPVVPTPVPFASRSRPARSGASERPPSLPRYRLEEFVGWAHEGELPQVSVKVTPECSGIFTDHGIANLDRGAVFIPSATSVPLGTLLGLHLLFHQPSERRIDVRGRVIWENTGAASKRLSGLGVSFINLSLDDKSFIKRFLTELSPAERPLLEF